MDIQQNVFLAPYTTVKIGGPAEFFVHTKNSDEFIKALNYGKENNLPITILGNGSNVLISDSGIRGLVIKNDSNEIEILPENKVKVASGVKISQILDFLAQNQLSGLENFSYIPTTIGGAIYGNIHGFDKTNFSEIVDSIEVFNLKNNQIETIIPDPSQWSYDHSPFQSQPHLVILSSILKLKVQKTEIIKQTIKDINNIKSSKQLMNSLGSVFKNIPNQDPIGQIIDQKLNLKGYSIGDAQVSPLHANFIINNNHFNPATAGAASDYLKLIRHIQSQALEKLNLTLEPEIKLIGEF